MAKVREICDGKGANVAFDAAGVQTGLNQAILSLCARGTLVNIAVWEKSATIIPNHLLFRERKYMGVTFFVEGDFLEVIGAIASGKFAYHIGSTGADSPSRKPEAGINDH